MAANISFRAARSNIQLIQRAIRNGNTLFSPQTVNTKVPVRCGHGNKMYGRAGRFNFREWLNDVNFYLYLGFIPFGVVVAGANTFVGKAELADIPEGYEPKEWEYYRHPIQRFLVKYVYESAQTQYERSLHTIAIEQHKMRSRVIEMETTAKMRDRGDVKGWYFMPVDAGRIYKAREVNDTWSESKGRP